MSENRPESSDPPAQASAQDGSRPYPGRGLHWVALFAAAFTWPLLISGGQVTTYKVGMAVPDWPSTFNENMFLYNFWNSPLGVFIEHRHRLFGAALGFASIVLAVWTVAADPRRWMKVLGVVAFLAVGVQGLIGGLRVLMNSTLGAALHACSGQAVFALLVAIAVWTGPSWWKVSETRPDVSRFRPLAWSILALVYLQIVLGAWVRHFPSPLAAGLHAFVAVCVLGHAGHFLWRIKRNRETVPFLIPSARTMEVLLGIQVVLGLAAFWILMPFDGTAGFVSSSQALIRTGHQANGALLLASAVVLTLRAFGHFGQPALSATSTTRGVVEAGGKKSDLEIVF